MPPPSTKAPQEPDDSLPVRHELCWAKTTPDGEPGISVRDHCLNVGCVAEALLELLPASVRALLPQGVATLAALHDIGKVSPGFQVKCRAWLDQHGLLGRALSEGWNVRVSDHAKITQATVQAVLGKTGLYPWAVILGAHHGRVNGLRVNLREPWEDERRRLAEEIVSTLGALPTEAPDDAMAWLVAGLISVADWIGSDERFFSNAADHAVVARRLIARTALEEIGWSSPERRLGLGFSDLFPSTPSANALQAAASGAVRQPGVYVIEGPMGFGKTEAALLAAYQLMSSGQAGGVYFALPTQITSNRIHLRVQAFVARMTAEEQAVRLAHSASWLLEDDLPRFRPASPDAESRAQVRAGRSWFASSKRALLTPFGVGTIDQALLGIVAANHFFVRQFGLAGKVVILDEVHTYDLYTSTLIDTLVRRLRELKCTVVVLSATLTEKRRRALLQLGQEQPLSSAYPLVSGLAGQLVEIPCAPPPSKDIQISFPTASGVIEDSLRRSRAGQCVLWIRNTVNDAQSTYRALCGSNTEGGPEIALLHSRFPFFRRQELEEKWMASLGRDASKRPGGCVLISTQVAEQSVDIDADLLITDFAPTDMLLQRLGRLWRHERARPSEWRPEVWIQRPVLTDEALRHASEVELRKALGPSAKVYAPYVLLRSLEQWRPRDCITLPGDIRTLLEATYADASPDEPPAWRQLRENLEEKKSTLAAHALAVTNVWAMPALRDEEGVQTRYGMLPTVQLLVARGIERVDAHSVRLHLLDESTTHVHDYEWSFGAAKAIYRNLVPVPRYAVRAALLNVPTWLSNHVHQPAVVGVLQPDGAIRWPSDENETGLSYRADQGIIIRRENLPRAVHEGDDESFD